MASRYIDAVLQGGMAVHAEAAVSVVLRPLQGRPRADSFLPRKVLSRSYRRMPLCTLIGCAVACSGAWLAALSHAQTIRIPDFRQESAVVTVRPGEACNNCGRVVSLQESQVEGRANLPPAYRGTVPGSAAGTSDSHLVGAVIFLPLGDETTEKPFVGGVGTPEMRERFRETTYKMTVRLDDGALRFLQRYDGYRFRVGDRVRLSGVDQVELLAE